MVGDPIAPTTEGTPPTTAFEALGGWPVVLTDLLSATSLTAETAETVMGQVLAGEASPAQIAALAIALRAKGESVDEMTGFVRAMVAHAVPLDLPAGLEVIDTCGTGGDRLRSINVSTIAALVVAATGAKVCKHGGRASSSAVGAADVLEALGVVADLGPAGVVRCIDEVGMGFCFAPRFHPAMRFAAPVRKELGVPTVFNYLGPLANPGRARYQVVGVSNPAMADKMLGVLAANGAQRAVVVYGDDGLDELSTTGPSTVHELIRGDDGRYETSAYRVDPRRPGLRARPPSRTCAVGMPRSTPPPSSGSSGDSPPRTGTSPSSTPPPPWWWWERSPICRAASCWPGRSSTAGRPLRCSSR